MANGHVKIHDPFSDHNGGSGCDPESTSDSASMEDSVELRLMMAFAKRRRPQREPPQREPPQREPPQREPSSRDGHLLLSGGSDASESSSLQTPEKEEEEKKKTRKKRRLWMTGWRRNMFSCIKPRTEDEEPRLMGLAKPDVDDRCGPARGPMCDTRGKEEEEEEEEEEDEKLKETAKRLTEIADEIPFLPPDIESDSPEDADADENVEKLIGLLLRDAGDRLNEAELQNTAISSELFWNYSFFKLLLSTLLERMGLRSLHPDSPGPKASPITQIAVTCEVTTRLAALSSLPRIRLLGHGARYLQHYYSSWAQEKGGYVKAFYSDNEEDEDQ